MVQFYLAKFDHFWLRRTWYLEGTNDEHRRFQHFTNYFAVATSISEAMDHCRDARRISSAVIQKTDGLD